MRQKEKKLIITFHTTADAMAMEKFCKEKEIPGRLIPVPRSISAGCGLSWCTDLSEWERMKEVVQQAGIDEEAMQECTV